MKDIKIIKKSRLKTEAVGKENALDEIAKEEFYQIIRTETVELNMEEIKRRKNYLQSALRECNKQKERLKEWEESLIKELSQIEELIKSEGDNN